MTRMNPSNILAAFEILVEEIEEEIRFVNHIGARAFSSQDYEQAREALAQSEEVSAFRDRVVALRREWERLSERDSEESEMETHPERQNLGRLRRGLRTPEKAYFQPILESLRELGGSAQMNRVLELVFERMRTRLRDVDHEPLASDPETPRWRNAAQWARNTMVQEGLLRDDSPRGTWEISDAGVRYLEALRSA